MKAKVKTFFGELALSVLGMVSLAGFYLAIEYLSYVL